MQLIETEGGRVARGAKRSTGNSSPTQRGEGRTKTLAAARSSTHGIWAPVLAKGLAIFCGMLGLAAIGAASLSRGAGVPVGTALAAHPARVNAAGMAPLVTVPSTPTPAALEESAPDAGAAPAEPGKASPGLTADGKVILNRADAGELRRLPGVGPKRAEAIVALRLKLGGRFKRVSDLLRVKGIGPKGLKKLEPHCVLDEPKQS